MTAGVWGKMTASFRLQGELWQLEAACRGKDPNLWFGSWAGQEQRLGGRPTKVEPDHLQEARAICRGCAVRYECADYALRTRTREGIWGGMNERQRRDWNRRGRKAFPT